MVASRSLYALWVGTSGLEGEASGCEEGNDAIRVGYWFDSVGTSAFAGCGHAAMKTLGSYVTWTDSCNGTKFHYSSTRSAVDSSCGGIVKPSALAACIG